MDSSASVTELVSPLERRTVWKICTRLLPLLGLMYLINFMDRTAISFAAPNGMLNDLAMTAAQYGLAAGMFSIGYIVLEIPSNLILVRVGARIWLARIMISWGIVSLLFTWVESASHLYILRFLLGVAESGFFPGVILYLATWVPSQHRAKIFALFYLAIPLSTVVGAPFISMLIAGHGWLNLEGWRLMFFGVSIPAIMVGVIALFYLPDRPADAAWLDDDERDWLVAALSKEDVTRRAAHGTTAVLQSLTSPRVWLLALVYFGLCYGLYALGFFVPIIVSGFEEKFGTSLGVMQRGFIVAAPYLVASIGLYLWSRDVTRRGARTWHVAGPTIVAGLTIPVAMLMTSPEATILIITITATAVFSALPQFWSLPTRFLSGTGAAAGIALINSIGNVAGFSAPYITGWVRDTTGSYELAMVIVGAVMLVAAILVISLAAKSAR